MRKERLKKLVSFYKPYKTVFFLDLLCSLAKAGIALVLPLGVGHITGALLERVGQGTASGDDCASASLCAAAAAARDTPPRTSWPSPKRATR